MDRAVLRSVRVFGLIFAGVAVLIFATNVPTLISEPDPGKRAVDLLSAVCFVVVGLAVWGGAGFALRNLLPDDMQPAAIPDRLDGAWPPLPLVSMFAAGLALTFAASTDEFPLAVVPLFFLVWLTGFGFIGLTLIIDQRLGMFRRRPVAEVFAAQREIARSTRLILAGTAYRRVGDPFIVRWTPVARRLAHASAASWALFSLAVLLLG